MTGSVIFDLMALLFPVILCLTARAGLLGALGEFAEEKYGHGALSPLHHPRPWALPMSYHAQTERGWHTLGSGEKGDGS